MHINNVKPIVPDQLGWLEAKLSQECIDRLWLYIKNHNKISAKNVLAGNISSSFYLNDEDNWLYKNVLENLCIQYQNFFHNLGNKIGVTHRHYYCLDSIWVNFQNQHEFNPTHDHSGVYSFVIWMKIPYDFRKQHQIQISSNTTVPSASNFQFLYSNILGEIKPYNYFMDETFEGTIIFFPSKLVHQVYPFFDCNEERISISGNITLNTSFCIE